MADLTHRRRAVIAALAVVIVIGAVYFYIDPESGLMPRCAFKTLTGYDCPGCGAQRSLHALLHGDLPAAWSYNPAIFVFLPLLILYGAVELFRCRNERLERVLYSSWTLYTIAAALIAWWLLRNMI